MPYFAKIIGLGLLVLVTAFVLATNLSPISLPVILGMLWLAVSVYTYRYIQHQQHEIETLKAASYNQNPQRQARRVVQLSTLNKVLSLLTETLSPDSVLDTVISSASAISEATAVAVYLLNDDQDSLSLVRSAGLSDDFSAEPLHPLLSLKDQQTDTGQPVVIENVHLHQQAAHLRSSMTREGKAAWIELPLWVAGRDLGIAILYFDGPQTFSGEDIELLRTFANQAAQAIQNAHLYSGTYAALENRVEQLSTLAAIGRELTATMNVETIANLILKYAIDATCATAGSIVLMNEKRDRLVLAAQSGYLSGTTAKLDRLSKDLMERTFEQTQHTGPFQGADLSLLASSLSHLSVPIMWRGETTGMITLESNQQNAFTAEDNNFISQMANQMVIAVDNARLFQHVTEARDRMQTILDTMAEAIVLIDRWGHIALANPRVDLIDLNSQQLIGGDIHSLLQQSEMHLAERLGFQSDDELSSLIVSILDASTQPEMLSYSLSQENKMLYIHRQTIPVYSQDSGIIGVLLVFQDETEQREMERARESFSRMIVHDLRSPLTAVTSGLSLLTEIIPPESEYGSLVVKTANLGQRAVRKLLNRVNSLLDISRMQSGQLMLNSEAASLTKLVDNVFAELNPLAHELNITLKLQVTADFPALQMDTDKVERVLLNLIDNALKFSPRSSSIIVQMIEPDPDLARIEVIDCGPGIPETYRKNIFDSFTQIREQRSMRRGSGLGLTFCKLAIEAHGGRIWVEDNPQGGSIFIFTLPVARTASTVLKHDLNLL